MKFQLFSRAGPAKAPKIEAKISLSCDQLVRDWGAGAYDRATFLSWEEDFGFSRFAKPGHWWRVRREIDRRNGQVTQEPTVAIAG